MYLAERRCAVAFTTGFTGLHELKVASPSQHEAEYTALDDKVKKLLFPRQVWRFIIPCNSKCAAVVFDF